MLDFFTFEQFKKEDSLLHAITTKSTQYPYNCSLALHTGEEAKQIVNNREEIARHLHTDTLLSFIVANQTHSANIIVIEKNKTQGWRSIQDAIENCDALITNLPYVALTILTADCVPILLWDKKEGVIAAVHAGWKGTQAKIVEKSILKMQKVYGSQPENIYAGIAPSIGKCCYEVGEDVAQYFKNSTHAHHKNPTKTMLDLPAINKEQLLHAGLLEKNIEMSNICTACNTQSFFSYRKENGCTGRFMSIIALKEKNEN